MDSTDGVITVKSCSWALDGKALATNRCSSNNSSPRFSMLNPGHHSVTLTLHFSNGDSASTSLSFTSVAFKLTAVHTKLSISCPSSINGSSFKCTVSARNTLGIKGIIAVTPQYKMGSKWFSLKGLNLAVGSKATVAFPNKMPKTQTVRFTSNLLGVVFTSPSKTYHTTETQNGPSPTNILQRLKAKGSSPWRDYSGSNNGFGPSPDYYYATTDPSGLACSVYVYLNPYSLAYDVNVGNFPSDNRSWQSFIDKLSGFGIAVEYGSLSSKCGQVLQKVFGR